MQKMPHRLRVKEHSIPENVSVPVFHSKQSVEFIRDVLKLLIGKEKIFMMLFKETLGLVKLSFRLIVIEKKAHIFRSEAKKLIGLVFEAIFIEHRVITGCCLALGAPYILRHAIMARIEPHIYHETLPTLKYTMF